jgi:hypothetical protein
VKLYTICKQGHAGLPENIDKWGRCKKCHAHDRRLYNQTPKAKETRKEYTQLPRIKEAMKRYAKTPKGKRATRKADLQTRLNVTRAYAAAQLRIPVALMTDDLYQLQREKILLYRAIKELKQTIKEIEEN